jgi:hypothetical protein
MATDSEKISYGYSCQNNKAGISSMKTKTDGGIYLTYFIQAQIALHVSTYNLGHHQAPLYDLYL